jgi:hypothetical protein
MGCGWEKGCGFNYFSLNCMGRSQTEIYVTWGDSNILILSYSFSISRLYRIPQNISLGFYNHSLIPWFITYMQFTIGVGVSITTILNTGPLII